MLVTGATGFVGQRLVRALLDAGYRVRATGRNQAIGASLSALGAEFVPAELTDAQACTAVVAGVDLVVHTAARTQPWGRAADFKAANLTVTSNVLEAAAAHAVTRVVHFSSPSVQSRTRDQLNLREGDVPSGRFLSPYASSKWAAEQLAADYSSQGFDIVVLRPKAIYGPGDTTIMPHVLEALRTQRVARLGKGNVLTNFVHVDDVVAATLLSLEAPVAGRTFTIAHPEPIDVWEALDGLSDRVGYRRVRRRLPRQVVLALAEALERAWALLAAGREPPVTRYAVSLLAYSQTYDTSAAIDGLGFRARVPFAQGLDEVAGELTQAARIPMPSTPVAMRMLNTGWVRARGWLVGEGQASVRLPVLCGLVEHPTRGWGLIDTGYSPRFLSATSRFPYSLYRRFTPATIRPEDSVAAQLRSAGIGADDIRWIVLTHLDPDHSAGVADFPDATVYVAHDALAATSRARGVSGLVRHRQLPGMLPDDFPSRSQAVHLDKTRWGPFQQSADLFGDESLILVDLPGHVPGHVGIVLADKCRGIVLWCGDSYWTRGALESTQRGRAHLWLAHHRHVQEGTYGLLRRVRAADPDLVMVASHDPQSVADFELQAGDMD